MRSRRSENVSISSAFHMAFVTMTTICTKVCKRSYTRRCMNMQRRYPFNKLYHDTNEVIRELWEKKTYQQDFHNHSTCMRHVIQKFTKRVQCDTKELKALVASSIYPTMSTYPANVLSNGGE